MERDYLAITAECWCEISTHTLTWSVTGGCVEYYSDVLDFNSHAHVERDLGVSISQNSISISTHTLTWSVTDEIVGNFTKGRISTHTLTWSVTC